MAYSRIRFEIQNSATMILVQCWDNAPGESIWSSLKRETLIGRKRFDSYEQAVITVTRWIETYNTIRPHSTIGMLTPVNYEKQLLGVS